MSQTANNVLRESYSHMIRIKIPMLAHRPILSGFNIINGQIKDYIIVIFKDTTSNGIMPFEMKEFNYEILV